MAKGKSRKVLFRYLIRNYNRIREECDQEIIDRMAAEKDRAYSLDWFADLMEGRDPDAWAERMRGTSHLTEELIIALDFALLAYRNLSVREGMRSWRQYDALYSKYFSTFSSPVWEIAYKYGVSKTVIYDDLNEAVTRLESIVLGDQADENDNFFGGK